MHFNKLLLRIKYPLSDIINDNYILILCYLLYYLISNWLLITKISSLSFFIKYFSLAYFSIVWAFVFNKSNSLLASVIVFTWYCSLYWKLFNFLYCLIPLKMSFSAKKSIQIKKKLPAKKYLFLIQLGICANNFIFKRNVYRLNIIYQI